jgi:hypothetical protein
MTATIAVRRALGAATAGVLGIGLLAAATPSSSAVASAPTSTAPVVSSGADGHGNGDHISKQVRRVVLVGNNWDGTADILRPKSFKRLGRINIVPDKDERMAEIAIDPYRLAYFLAIRQAIGEGHDQLVDDLYSSNDGRMVIASRPSFADVVAISLETGQILWRFTVEGVRSDHMAISPNGKKLAVSASTGNVVHVLRVADGKELGRVPSGGSPHENVFIDGGKRILHASIGMVYSPLDDPALDPTKQERVLQIVDAKPPFPVLRRFDVRKALDEAGLEDVSSAVRPLTLSPDDHQLYFQLSFFHGFVQMDRVSGKIVRVRRLPNLVPDMPREEYLLDSAHHGIAMNHAGSRICVAGTMSDYATVLKASSLNRGPLLKGGLKPYWVTPSWDGKYCYISWSGSDKISKISYKTRRIVQDATVGDHPQRVRNGFVRKSLVRGLPG